MEEFNTATSSTPWLIPEMIVFWQYIIISAIKKEINSLKSHR